MGQIVSSAAKPKRCNLSKLSQLGTPAAGEHILVSYDNSMMANGQGNFDRYIIGDGRTAATALELKYLDDSTRPYIVEEVNKAVADIQPIEITGDVTNAPDEEDLTSENQGGTDVLKFKDKAYNAALYSGLGRVYLRKNIVTLKGVGKNVLTQAMVNTANTIYHIQYDYDLNGQTITLPAGCVLEFDGGSVKNGTIIGQNTIVRAFNRYIFRGVSVSGVFNETYHSDWFVKKNDGSDCTTDMNFLFSSGNGHTIIIDEGKYAVNANYTLAQGTKLKGYSLCVGRNNVVRKSHFYLHDCSGTFLDCSAGYIVIENLTFDGTNGITDNNSTTIEQFISANSKTGFIVINGCEICGTSYLGACAVNLGQSMWVEIKNSQIHHVINGYAVIFNGSNTTINFHKVYFTYNRQSLNISSGSGFTKFSCCVFESSYTLGRIAGSNIFDTCHFENIGYDLSEHYEGLTTIYESDSTPLDSFAELVRGKTEFANCVFYHCFNGSHHTYGFRLYPNTIRSTYIRNGYLLINNCLLENATYNSFELSNVLYVYGNNTSIAEYFKIEMNCEYVSVNSSIYPYVKKLKGYGHARLHVYGNRNVEMCLEYGVAHYKFISYTSTGFFVPSNMPLELLDDEYCVKGFITYPTASHVHNKEYVSFVKSFTLVNTSTVAGTSFQLPTDASAIPAYYIEVGDKFTIYTDSTTAVTGTITAKTNTAVTFSVGFTIDSTPRILNIYATRPCGDSYGICTNLPTGLTTRQVGCIAIKGTSTYRWNGTAWMDVTGTAVQ